MAGLDWLCDATPFVPRAACGPGWSAELVFANQLGHCLAVAACAYIAAVTLKLYRRRRGEFPGTWLLPLFAGFVSLCGVSHLSEVVVFYAPAYRATTLLILVSAAFGWVAAVSLRCAAERLHAYPSLTQYEKALADAEAADARTHALLAEAEAARVRKRARIAALEAEAEALRAQVEELRHRVMTEHDYRELRERLNRLRENGLKG